MLSQRYNLSEAIEEAVIQLREVCENPFREAKLILAHVLNCSYEAVYFKTVQVLTKAEYQDFIERIYRRSTGEPLAKILGYKEFWGHRFHVNEHTLDPRPDSEVLVEKALKFAYGIFPTELPIKVLDLGTGSGCLLLSFLKDYKNATGVGIDISPLALEVAASNAKALELEKKTIFICSKWFDAFDPKEKFDVILCNPPYIDPEEEFGKELRYDPPHALFAPKEGLGDYEAIATKLSDYLSPKGHAFFEVGYTQGAAVTQIFLDNHMIVTDQHLDLSGVTRCLEISHSY